MTRTRAVTVRGWSSGRSVRRCRETVPGNVETVDRFNSLDIPESLQEVLEPARLAFVVYDMQVGILAQIARGPEVLHKIRRLLAIARQQRVRTVFMRHYFMPPELAGVYQLRQAKTWQGKERAAETHPLISFGSSGFQLAEGLEPQPTEAVFDKITMSAFEGTPLDIVLRDCGVRAYLIAGVATEVGIEPTVRHSTDLGFIPVVVTDACGAGDEAAGRRALENLAFAGDAILADTDEVCTLLASAG
jgi:nicotinamidase-related amidase